MNQVIHSFWKLCLFKLGPQDLPASGFLLLLVTAAYAVVSLLAGLLSLTPAQALMSAVLDVALVGAMTQLLLWIRELGTRFQQTFIALMGSGVIIGMLALPLIFIQVMAGEQFVLLPSLMMLGLMIWNLAVVGHILRHAIDAPFFVGVLLALIYMYVSISVMRSLFNPAS